jgi:hypothetical protein
MANSAFRIWTADGNGKPVHAAKEKSDDPPRPDPGLDEAVDIYVAPVGPPTDDQSKLHDDISYVLDVVRRLYLPDGARPNKPKFRAYYVRLFRLAQVGLESADPAPKQAKSALDALKASLLDDEGLHIKTKNLTRLGETALMLSIPLAIVYFVLLTSGDGGFRKLLLTLNIEHTTLANFMLLLIGCFTGVCLSYGVRTATLTLGDLVNPGPDRLPPGTRLIFIGTLTMLFGMLFINDFVEVKLGNHSTADIDSNPAVAFIVGAFFGLGEAALPGMAGKRAQDFLKGLQ